ncbi:enoyl-CoA hydratase/isomerase family protein, partial [Acinetobacter baumannii]
MSNVERVQDARAAEPEVLYAVDGNIATITLNRPERLNTISRPMLAQLGQLLLQADNDPDVRAVILTATGRAFCAGLDVG